MNESLKADMSIVNDDDKNDGNTNNSSPDDDDIILDPPLRRHRPKIHKKSAKKLRRSTRKLRSALRSGTVHHAINARQLFDDAAVAGNKSLMETLLSFDTQSLMEEHLKPFVTALFVNVAQLILTMIFFLGLLLGK